MLDGSTRYEGQLTSFVGSIRDHSLFISAPDYSRHLRRKCTENTSTEPTGDRLGAGQTPVGKLHESDSGLLQGVRVFLNKLVTNTWVNSTRERAKG
jgi:hypothetical protein